MCRPAGPLAVDLNQGKGLGSRESCRQSTLSWIPMAKPPHIGWLDSIRLEDLAGVGGKNASLGELHALLVRDGDPVPDGFVLTAHANREALDAAGAWEELRRLISDFDYHDVRLLAERAPPPPGNSSIRLPAIRAYAARRVKSAVSALD
jgi:Pyruvate phosphate dikinase, AMP/ATP-binding domain